MPAPTSAGKHSLAVFVLLLLSSPVVGAQELSAEALIERGRFKEARAVVERRLRAAPHDPQANYLMSQVKFAFGDREAARALAEKAVQLDSRSADYHFNLARVLGEMASDASFFKQIGLGRSFKKELDAALAADPNHLEANFAHMLFLLKAPGIIGGDKKKAREMPAKIAKLNPVRGLLAEARLASEDKRQDALEGIYARAAALDPNHYAVRSALASIYFGQKKYDQAEKQAREALRIDRQRPGAFGLLAVLYATTNQPAELDQILAQAEKFLPGSLNPHYQAGRVFLTEGRELERAEQYFRRYLTEEPEAGAPSHAGAHWRLALVLEKRGRKQEAVTHLRAAVKLDPKFEPAHKDLKRLKG